MNHNGSPGPRHKRQTHYTPAQHRWLWRGDVSPTLSVFVCRWCRVVVETPAALPSYKHAERWNGVNIGSKDKRPVCSGRKVG